MLRTSANKWWLLLAVFGFAELSYAAIVKYTDLPKERLPYGEVITIMGQLSDIEVAAAPTTDPNAPPPKTKLNEFITVTDLSVRVTVSGLQESTIDGTVADPDWSVSVGPFPENGVVSLGFRFSGVLLPKEVEATVDRMFQDPRYSAAVEAMFTAAEGRSAQDFARAANQFVESITPIIYDSLPPALKSDRVSTTEQEALLERLLPKVTQNLNSYLNLNNQIKSLKKVPQEAPILDSDKTYSPQEAKEELDEKLPTLSEKQKEDNDNIIRAFEAEYARVREFLEQTVTTEIAFSTTLSSTNTIRDFEKYAGLDVGGIYVPAIEEFRSFATINIYWGPVEETPAPGRYWQQRLSLTLGVSTGDLSSRTNSEVAGDNAFIYGLGFRLNKYFRLTTGGAMYRSSSADNRLRHAWFVGPSIDFSAFEFLRGMFGKSP